MNEGNCVFKDVLVLPLKNSNGTEVYTRECLEKAVELFAGLPIHIGRGAEPRLVTDRVGIVMNPELKDDGIHADVKFVAGMHIDKPLFDMLPLELNGMGSVEIVNSNLVITNFANIRSIDIVTEE